MDKTIKYKQSYSLSCPFNTFCLFPLCKKSSHPGCPGLYLSLSQFISLPQDKLLKFWQILKSTNLRVGADPSVGWWPGPGHMMASPDIWSELEASRWRLGWLAARLDQTKNVIVTVRANHRHYEYWLTSPIFSWNISQSQEKISPLLFFLISPTTPPFNPCQRRTQ